MIEALLGIVLWAITFFAGYLIGRAEERDAAHNIGEKK